MDAEDAPRSGKRFEAGEGKIKAMIDANCRITTPEIAEKLYLSNSTVHDSVKRLDLISKLDIWVLTCSYRNKFSQDACNQLLQTFLKKSIFEANYHWR